MLTRNSLWNNTVKIVDMDLKYLYSVRKLLHTYAKDRSKTNKSGYDTECFGYKIHQWIHILQLEIDRRKKIIFKG